MPYINLKLRGAAVNKAIINRFATARITDYNVKIKIPSCSKYPLYPRYETGPLCVVLLR